MVTATREGAWVRKLDRLLDEIESRRWYQNDVDDLANWHYVRTSLYTDTLEIVERVQTRTTGRFVLGLDHMLFEDEQDAIMFKLSSR